MTKYFFEPAQERIDFTVSSEEFGDVNVRLL